MPIMTDRQITAAIALGNAILYYYLTYLAEQSRLNF